MVRQLSEPRRQGPTAIATTTTTITTAATATLTEMWSAQISINIDAPYGGGGPACPHRRPFADLTLLDPIRPRSRMVGGYRKMRLVQVRSERKQRDQQRQIRNEHSREHSNDAEVASVSASVKAGPQISERPPPSQASDSQCHRHSRARLGLMY
jgi:hypothetical protein